MTPMEMNVLFNFSIISYPWDDECKLLLLKIVIKHSLSFFLVPRDEDVEDEGVNCDDEGGHDHERHSLLQKPIEADVYPLLVC